MGFIFTKVHQHHDMDKAIPSKIQVGAYCGNFHETLRFNLSNIHKQDKTCRQLILNMYYVSTEFVHICLRFFLYQYLNHYKE